MKLKTTYLTYSNVGKEAKNCLDKHWPKFELPIPIEKIIDVNIGIHIDTIPGLYKNYELNGFLTADRTTIYVDETQYDQYYKKCRFTLAHELGHYVLHKECYNNLPSSVEDYIKWRLSIPQEEISWFEIQAHWFAEQILIPRNQLMEKCIATVGKYKNEILELIRYNSRSSFWSYASDEIAQDFEVNPPAIERRINREDFIDEINTRIDKDVLKINTK